LAVFFVAMLLDGAIAFVKFTLDLFFSSSLLLLPLFLFLALLLPAPFPSAARPRLRGLLGYQFYQPRLTLPLALPQEPAQALDELPRAPSPTDDDSDGSFRHVYPLVEHLRGHYRSILPFPEALQHVVPLLFAGRV